MAKKTALITGISGQDGAYLAKFLLKKNYKVIGTDRRSARSNNWRLIELNIENKVILEDLDITEINNLIRIRDTVSDQEIINNTIKVAKITLFSKSLICVLIFSDSS